MGRPAMDQSDFGPDVGIADCACVNQFGQANNSKYYHGGVVQSTKTSGWYCYFEWGRIFSGKSWNGRFAGQDFQFVECDSEAEARSEFAKQMHSKNTKRGQWTTVAGVKVWAAKPGEDGYIVQSLATREKGLPDAYTIKDSTGVTPNVAAPASSAPARKTVKSAKTFHPEVIRLAQSLVGGTRTYTRALSAAAGVTPTMDAIKRVRDDLIPAALERIKAVGNDVSRQVRDSDLVAVSKMVSAIVPRPIPRTGITAEEAVLNSNNITRLEQDLDAFEAALRGEDFPVGTATVDMDPDSTLNARLRYIDPNSDEGRWLISAFSSMTNNRHGYIRGGVRMRSMFAVERPDRDARFMAEVKRVAALRQGRFALRANLQPKRIDLGSDADLYAQANVIFAIHGTRPVNIHPIMSTNFRLPKSLPGALITGANFGHGIYWATDWKKSYGYTGRGYYGAGGGSDISGRGCFMFLSDMLMGDAYRAPSTGSWNTPPDGKDSVFGVGGDRGHRLENDEHVIFSPDHQRIRYLVEFDWLT